jgi:hypothetical protein
MLTYELRTIIKQLLDLTMHSNDGDAIHILRTVNTIVKNHGLTYDAIIAGWGLTESAPSVACAHATHTAPINPKAY